MAPAQPMAKKGDRAGRRNWFMHVPALREGLCLKPKHVLHLSGSGVGPVYQTQGAVDDDRLVPQGREHSPAAIHQLDWRRILRV